MFKAKIMSLMFVCLCFVDLSAQNEDVDVKALKPFYGIEYNIEGQGSFSKNKTPLWLNANKYGLSSLDKTNAYFRASVIRGINNDSIRKWGIGYGLDVVAPVNYTSKAVIQQAFVEARWLKTTLSLGSKEYPMELKNNELSSGSQTLGINSRPIPQVRLALADYYTLPFAKNWLHIKGHIAYGIMTDGNWQTQFTNNTYKHVNKALYHSKAGYLKIGNDVAYYPFSIELGLEMATIFGGTIYKPNDAGGIDEIKADNSIKAFWNAFLPGGYDIGETTYQNVQGNQLGSWVVRLNWNYDTWRIGVYADKFFEDHSSMLQLDYDGYGVGEEWQTKNKRRFVMYDFSDWLLGFDIHLKYKKWINNLVFEYLYSKYQSGPIYHDHTYTIADHIGGIDGYYNHDIYPGWQHWGQVIGNPLYQSPIYNGDGEIIVKNNRSMAFHLGINGSPFDNFKYRFIATYQEGYGTYKQPYTKKHHNISFLLEGNYSFFNGWNARVGYGMDFGGILGSSAGAQITISKMGVFL